MWQWVEDTEPFSVRAGNLVCVRLCVLGAKHELYHELHFIPRKSFEEYAAALTAQLK